MENKKKETFGQIVNKLRNKLPDKVLVTDQSQSMVITFDREVLKAVERGKSHFGGDFFVEVFFHPIPLVKEAIKIRYLELEACPLPEPDQAVFHYQRKDDRIIRLWFLPCREALSRYKNLINPDISKEEKMLRDDVFAFYDGSLLALSNKLNDNIKESKVSPSYNPLDFAHQGNLVIQSRNGCTILKEEV
jgi:hypothetical protein